MKLRIVMERGDDLAATAAALTALAAVATEHRLEVAMELATGEDVIEIADMEDDVVSWVRAFEVKHGRKPQIPEVQAQFRRRDGTTLPKTTAWRRIKSALGRGGLDVSTV